MRRIWASIVCAATLLFSALPASAAPDPRQAAMDVAVADGIPGMVAVAPDFRGSSGAANVTRPGKPDTSGRWRIGSVSKTFVATLALQLVAEKRVGLDEPVQDYLPGLLPYPEPITVRQLLQHTSGLPRDLKPEDSWASLPEVDTERFIHFSSTDEIRLSTEQPLLFAPGTSWSYSNTGYNVLGVLVEKITHQRLERALAERIAEPLHLRDTFLPRDFPFLPKPAAHGYEQLYSAPYGLTDVTTYNYSRYFGAGDVVSSGDDLNRFFQALLGGKLLPADLLKQMKATVSAPGMGFEYGLGLMRVNLKGICSKDITIWGHGGDLPGYNTLAFSDDSNTHRIATMANLDITVSGQAAVARQLPMVNEFCTPHLPNSTIPGLIPSAL